MHYTRQQLEEFPPFGDWGHYVTGTTITTLCRSYRFEMIASNAKRGYPLHLLVFIPATKLAPEALVQLQAGAYFRAVCHLEAWPRRSYGVPDHPPHLFVTQPIEIEAP